jgi:hypothetical protein
MQAQMQAATRPSTIGRNPAAALIAFIAAMHVLVHATWYIIPQFVDDNDVGPAQYIVITSTLVLGLVALAGLWKGQRWGWWLMLVTTAINIYLTLPEVFGLEGLMRAGSIVGMVVFLITLVVLFRPEVRAIRR